MVTRQVPVAGVRCGVPSRFVRFPSRPISAEAQPDAPEAQPDAPESPARCPGSPAGPPGSPGRSPGSPARRPGSPGSDTVFYWLLKYVVLGPLLKLVFRPDVRGLANVPASGPVILACNHLSFSDSIFTPLLVERRVTF